MTFTVVYDWHSVLTSHLKTEAEPASETSCFFKCLKNFRRWTRSKKGGGEILKLFCELVGSRSGVVRIPFSWNIMLCQGIIGSRRFGTTYLPSSVDGLQKNVNFGHLKVKTLVCLKSVGS